jgi:hypothetical protein
MKLESWNFYSCQLMHRSDSRKVSIQILFQKESFFGRSLNALRCIPGLIVKHVVKQGVEAIVGTGQRPQELLYPKVHSQGPCSVRIVPTHFTLLQRSG